jgi:hypothetical protein
MRPANLLYKTRLCCPWSPLITQPLVDIEPCGTCLFSIKTNRFLPFFPYYDIIDMIDMDTFSQ